MTGDCCNLVSKETREALCDMTNVPSKRGISSILGDLLLKTGDDSGKVVVREGSGVKFSKRLCLVVDDLVKENTRTRDTNDGSSSGGDSDNFDVKESQGETDAVDTGVGPFKGDEMKEKDCDMTANLSQTDAVTGEDMAMTVFGSSKSFSMNRCSGVESMGIVNHDMEADDELKSCSCSFCLKAAYIWSDLHYQDMKSRLSVLKKSQKEASSLVQRNSKGKPMDIHGSANSDRFGNGEYDLMGQWTSLFLNMEGILANESNHLQSSFLAMKELRENCKIDLEKASKAPQHNST